MQFRCPQAKKVRIIGLEWPSMFKPIDISEWVMEGTLVPLFDFNCRPEKCM